jgi:hypothetical protein
MARERDAKLHLETSVLGTNMILQIYTIVHVLISDLLEFIET